MTIIDIECKKLERFGITSYRWKSSVMLAVDGIDVACCTDATEIENIRFVLEALEKKQS